MENFDLKKIRMSKFKNNIISIVYIITESLNAINKITINNVSDENLIKSYENIRNVIFEGIANIKKHVDILSIQAEWDKLNISFFGETNAGKSTIIESLINGDGLSIGEGYKDFTKKVTKISYVNVNLLDMPGIEGREYKVIKSIRKAIDHSHVVFYVVGTNKEPEEQTIAKIKRFLKDNVKVYSILNLRGKPTAYKYKSELKDKNSIVVENRIKTKFNKLLEGNYSGNIIINGYLSLLKSNSLKNTRFEKDQLKALEIFKDKKKIESFSNIVEIYRIIDFLNNDIYDEIIISNTYKFLNSLSFILSKILREKKIFDTFIKKTNELTNKYLVDIDQIRKKYISEINNILDVNINRLRVDLKKVINEAIEDRKDESFLNTKLNKIKDKQSKNLNDSLQNFLSSMKSEIEKIIDAFKNRVTFKMSFLNLKGEFDLENILETLELNFKYVLDQIIDIGLSIWGVVVAFVFNPILGVLAGIFALLRKIWGWFFGDPDERKREAKKKANDTINMKIKEIEKKAKRDLEKEIPESVA